jgi:cystathionine beta-lyase
MNYLNINVNYVMDFCSKKIPEIIPLRTEATYMIWLDCRKLKMSGKELQKFFVANAGVGMNEGSTFGQGGEGYMRMNLACPLKIVEKAWNQIEDAIIKIR